MKHSFSFQDNTEVQTVIVVPSTDRLTDECSGLQHSYVTSGITLERRGERTRAHGDPEKQPVMPVSAQYCNYRH
jgi:hypothetical protein